MSTLEGFVRASGAVMGQARDSFGGGVALAPPPTVGATPGEPGGAGRAADGSLADSSQVRSDVSALAGHDSQGGTQLGAAVAASGVGRARMDTVIAAAVADVTDLGMATNTPQGRAALVSAIKHHLEDSKTTLDGAATDAGTRAAAAAVTTAGYNATGASPSAMGMMPQAASMLGSAVPQMAGMATAPASMLTGLGGAMPLGSLAELGTSPDGGGGTGMTGPPPSTGQVLTSDDTVAGGAVRRALGQLGKPYVWGGTGPNGWDCSGLVQYAYKGVGINLPRETYDMVHVGQQVSPDQVQPGDLVFSEFSRRGPEHVQMAIGEGHVVEAQQSGVPVKISPLPSGHVVVKRVAA